MHFTTFFNGTIIFKLFIIIVLIGGIINDYPAYDSIPNLGGKRYDVANKLDVKKKGESMIQDGMTKGKDLINDIDDGARAKLEGMKSKIGNIKQGMKDTFKKYTETDYKSQLNDLLVDKEGMMEEFGEWKNKILQDIEHFWNQICQQIQEQQKKDSTGYDENIISIRLHKLIEKIIPQSLLHSREEKEIYNYLPEGEKMATVDVAGCTGNDLEVSISEEKKTISIQGLCVISDSDDANKVLMEKKIEERVKIPSDVNLDKIKIGLKNGMLCIVFPPLDIPSGGQIPLFIEEW